VEVGTPCMGKRDAGILTGLISRGNHRGVYIERGKAFTTVKSARQEVRRKCK